MSLYGVTLRCDTAAAIRLGRMLAMSVPLAVERAMYQWIESISLLKSIFVTWMIIEAIWPA